MKTFTKQLLSLGLIIYLALILLSPVAFAANGSSASQSKANINIAIEGDESFVKKTKEALKIIKKGSALGFETVTKYISVIRSGPFSGMYAWEDIPFYQVGSATANSSPTWYASTIVHDAYHSKLYHDYLKAHGDVPDDIWMGEKAEAMCLEFQISFLEEINAPEDEIEYAKSLRGNNYWDTVRTW